MTGLFHTLGMGAESLYNSRQGVDTTGHNIANAQVEGYSRQRVDLRSRDPSQTRGLTIGNGSYVKEIQRVHDKFVERQVCRSTHDAGLSATRLEALKNLENIYSPELNSSVSDEMSTFFNALHDLSTNPEELSVRTYVRETAKNLTSAFRRVDSSLRQNQDDLNTSIFNETKDVNDLLSGIAKLNLAVGEMEGGAHGQANDLRDERDRLVRQLSQKMQINYYEDKSGGLVIRGPKEISLVEHGDHATMFVQRNMQNGLNDIYLSDFSGTNERYVNDGIESGKLRGLLEVRDEIIPDLINKNNEMAYQLATSVNATHQQGYGIGDYKEHVGRNFFAPINDINRAAETIDIDDAIMGSTDAISAASSPNAPGDNVIANDLIRIRDTKLMPNNANLTEYYANYVGNLGLEVQRADHIKEADKTVLDDLNNKRESIAGVSLDEEATNLMKWQACFTASSKLITTVDEMIDTVLSLKR